MNTKLLMTTTALVMMGLGIIFSFLPAEASEFLTGDKNVSTITIFLQLTGALYFAFGMVNWTAKANLIGGIYGRPIALGNMTHFIIGGLALIKAYISQGSMVVLPLLLVYVVFGIAFAIVFFTHPIPEKVA
jgi:hypothetical protein